MNVADLVPEGHDALGFKIVCIYARKPPQYSVYRTKQRVLIQFADDREESDEQRKAVAQLAPVRGEINGLIDGWRTAPDVDRVLGLRIRNGAKRRSRAERYDRATADALQVALEGDLTGAGALLDKVKNDILSERIGWSRFEYLITAFLTVVVVALLSLIAMGFDAARACSNSADKFLCVEHAVDLWRGFLAGAVGGFFSIAIGIRGRTILPDLYRPANLMDAVLRVFVGSIGGVVLVSLILAHFVRFWLGDSSPDNYEAIHIFIIGFVAGFAERLVPDLLAKAEARTGEPPVTRRAEPQSDTKLTAGTKGALRSVAQTEATQLAEQSEPAPEQAGEDSCVAQLDLHEDEITRDEDLPRASGGIDRAQGAE